MSSARHARFRTRSRVGFEPAELSTARAQAGKPADELCAEAAERLSSMFDPRDGGFGSAPKFPQPLLLDLLLRDHLRRSSGASLDIVERTLEAMASGGIYDHLGGGFARYSVDPHWDVPHFEKMLYDQALIARVYLHSWQLDGDPRWLQVLTETVSYVLRDLRDPGGALYAAEDADSEGEEGRFYVWSAEELTSLLGPDLGAEAAEWYGVTAEGNFEGRTVLHRARRGDLQRPPRIETARSRLLAARAGRVRPGLDDKIITEWNAMMCSTLAEAAAVTGRDDWSRAAAEIATFLLEHLRRADGRVLRSWCQGRAEVLGYAADYAWLIDCCTRLGELSGDSRWTMEAVTIARQMLELFTDDGRSGLYTTGSDAAPLVVRPRETPRRCHAVSRIGRCHSAGSPRGPRRRRRSLRGSRTDRQLPRNRPGGHALGLCRTAPRRGTGRTRAGRDRRHRRPGRPCSRGQAAFCPRSRACLAPAREQGARRRRSGRARRRRSGRARRWRGGRGL